MKKMKISLLTCFIAAMLLGGESCKKYEDGPLISFRTPERRLQGRYHAGVFTINGQDALQLWNDSICSNYFELRYDQGMGKRIVRLDSYKKGISGLYFLSEHNSLIALQILGVSSGYKGYTPFNVNDISVWKIIKLSNKRLHISSNINGTEYYLELEKFMDSLD